MEPLGGFLLWKVGGNCLKTLICGPQKHLHDRNETVKTESMSGASPKAEFQTLGIMEEGLLGRCPPETLVTPVDGTDSFQFEFNFRM